MKTLRAVAVFLASLSALAAAEEGTGGFEGVWTGEAVAPNASAAFALEFTAGEKGLQTRISMPTMFLDRMPLGPAKIENDSYLFPPLGIKVTRHGDTLEGTFANPLVQLHLRRGGEMPARIPTEEAPEGPKPLWSRALGEKVWASPVVGRGVIYLGTTAGKLRALRLNDGSDVWSWSGEHAFYGAAAIADGVVYALDEAETCVALRTETGELLWRVSLAEGVGGSKNPTFNHRTPTPVIVDGQLVIGSSAGTLFVLDAKTGETRWRHAVGAPVFATVGVNGDEAWVGAYDGSVIALSLSRRVEIARGKVGGPVVSTPVVDRGVVVVGSRDYLLYGLRREDLSTAWRDSFWFSWVESTPRLESGVAYIGGSDYRRISAVTTTSGLMAWSTDVGGLTWGTPVVTSNRVYAGTSGQEPAVIKHQGGIVALDRATGRLRWRIPVSFVAGADRAGVLGSLSAAEGKLIAACYDGTVIALPLEE